jgi:hypothetical protein
LGLTALDREVNRKEETIPIFLTKCGIVSTVARTNKYSLELLLTAITATPIMSSVAL